MAGIRADTSAHVGMLAVRYSGRAWKAKRDAEITENTHIVGDAFLLGNREATPPCIKFIGEEDFTFHI